MDLAAVDQSAADADDLVLDADRARLRPHATRPRVPQLRGQRGPLRTAAERLGRAYRYLGARPSRAHAAEHARRDQRQRRRVLGAARPARTGPAARLHVSIALAG